MINLDYVSRGYILRTQPFIRDINTHGMIYYSSCIGYYMFRYQNIITLHLKKQIKKINRL